MGIQPLTHISTTDTLRTLYDDASTSWHRSITRIGVVNAYNHLFEQLHCAGHLRHLNPQSQVLDAGIGTGALSLALVEQTRTQPFINGVDISGAMLRQAEAHLAQVGVDSHMSQQDATHLQFADATFDMVMSAHMLEHLENPLDGLRELVRVLKPGAPLLILTSRRGVITTFHKYRWHYEPISHMELVGMMKALGLASIHVMPYSNLPWIRDMSAAICGLKTA